MSLYRNKETGQFTKGSKKAKPEIYAKGTVNKRGSSSDEEDLNSPPKKKRSTNNSSKTENMVSIQSFTPPQAAAPQPSATTPAVNPQNAMNLKAGSDPTVPVTSQAATNSGSQTPSTAAIEDMIGTAKKAATNGNSEIITDPEVTIQTRSRKPPIRCGPTVTH